MGNFPETYNENCAPRLREINERNELIIPEFQCV